MGGGKTAANKAKQGEANDTVVVVNDVLISQNAIKSSKANKEEDDRKKEPGTTRMMPNPR